MRAQRREGLDFSELAEGMGTRLSEQLTAMHGGEQALGCVDRLLEMDRIHIAILRRSH